ncbi:hypothetical protein HOP50_10g59800 [Chloropicon primus]|uniref:Tetraspanin n=1 Tax=Chloropicon primus TaxID=1764295 RepID=A0A5B8MSW5_9CHLO|nr:hypothetical protein A3770_10p59590 [Chloropicon primus]UPR02653.1 hypothetical protein HOP50_10g59800 [Chloropicon primus]|mmetsp:Transcript_8976/g.25608  ORF Transcript_8976/g.25608 Transcript_8976/m.25608 type:complete len:287 (-) Transcript_8976:2611-3471(-)|eukprot:QDZ23441.1 hypothetical protein A3770_10p59590 [Chloropicon primus]
MVCCIDKFCCEWILRVLNLIAALAGLFLLGCGLYLEFGGATSSSELLEFLKLHDIQEVFRVAARYPIWMIVLGAVIFVVALVSVFCTGASCSNCYYCVYSPVLMLCSAAIIFGAVILHLAAKTTASSDFQEIKILGYDLNERLVLLWAQGVMEDTQTMCELQEVVQCSGFYDGQCLVPPTNFTEVQVITGCPAQRELHKATGSLQTPSTITNQTMEAISEEVGYNVGKCLYYETSNVEFGCLRTLAEILYQVGNVLFIPGLVIGGYCFVLSLVASYLTCCTLCGKV